MKKWFKKSPTVAKNISPNQERCWAKLFAVPDAFTLGSFSDDSTAQTRSSPRLSADGGRNTVCSTTRTQALGACARLLWPWMGTWLCWHSQHMLLFLTNISVLLLKPRRSSPNLSPSSPQM